MYSRHARACAGVRVWVPARVGDAVARDTTVTFETASGGAARKGRGGEIQKGDRADCGALARSRGSHAHGRARRCPCAREKAADV